MPLSQQRLFARLSSLFLLSLLLATASAEVVRVEISERCPFADGKEYGEVGAYERISGRLYLETDPANLANARIADLKNAPTNAEGKVETWTDFFLLRPVDPSKGNGHLLYDVNNRGNMLALWTFNDGERTNDPRTEAHGGNGFLMRHGFSVLWCGWNGEVQADDTHRLLCGLPIATEQGKTITGPATLEFCTAEKVQSRAFSWSPWGIGAAYPTADLDDPKATLTMRATRDDEAVEIQRSDWAFARLEDDEIIPDATHLYIKDGFRPGWLYDLVYTAKEPRVTGLGLSALRDCISYFRYATGRDNPLDEAIQKATIYGISQSGRVIHHMLYEGLNRDEQNRLVFDGALVHVPGSGKGMFNYRFRMSTEFGSPHEGHLAGTEFFPLAPLSQTDPVTGEEGDFLARSRATDSVPRMIISQTSTEYWARAASLLHTDVEGKVDLELPDDIRLYLIAGAQHLGKGDGTPGAAQQPRNTLDDRGPIQRALLLRLVDWVQNDVLPPASRYPRIADGTLIDFETWKTQFPTIPNNQLPLGAYQPSRLDFGPRFHTEGIADTIPPKIGKNFHALVPAVDADGIDIAGIHLPEVTVPLGTYTGWNLRSPDTGVPTMLTRLDGMFLRFAKTRAEQEASGDSRPSLQERYASHDDYIAKIVAAAKSLQKEGLLLPEDGVRIIARARAMEW